MTRRIVSATAAVALVLASCGGSDPVDETPESSTTSDAVVVTEPSEEFTESSGTAAAEPEPSVTDAEPEPAATEPEPSVTDAEPVDEPGGSAVAGALAVSLAEWAIEAPTEYTAGEVTFTATNNGRFPHEFVVIQGESYESLPLEEGGAVIEADLPTGALIGRTAKIGGGSSEDLTVTLAPGNYVLICNLGGGATSHAGQGQRLDISVS